MDTDTIKAITDAGLGFGALIALVLIVFKQLDILKTVNENINANTVVTKGLIEQIKQFADIDRQVVDTIKNCPNAKG
jgi:hypothetical protein